MSPSRLHLGVRDVLEGGRHINAPRLGGRVVLHLIIAYFDVKSISSRIKRLQVTRRLMCLMALVLYLNGIL